MILNTQRTALMKLLVVVVDLIVLNGLFAVFYSYRWYTQGLEAGVSLISLLFAWNMAYLVGVLSIHPIAHKQLARAAEIARRSFLTGLIMTFFYVAPLHFLGLEMLEVKPIVYILLWVLLLLFSGRLMSRFIIRLIRSKLSAKDHLIFVGGTYNIADIYDSMISELSFSYHPLGYFYDEPVACLDERMSYLGKVADVPEYLAEHSVQELYCSLQSARSQEARSLIHYCENHLVRFYSIPNVSNYVHNQMSLGYIGDYPVLSLRDEPLRQPINAFIKRTFDVVFSLLFLCTLFIPIYIVVGIIIKRSSPGPIFFKQKRNGLDGREFYCLKFRSMHVNDQSDVLQATEHDPRKFKFGDFMRRTNIDELPQFINVLKGEMSVVGPRPHMVKHTEEYGELIDKYMVRHFAKPGITGWAQVNGCRGETKELWQMEARIKKDIWYVEHWSFWLDLHIIWETIANVLFHKDKQAY